MISDFEAFYEERNAKKYVTSDNPDNTFLVNRMLRWLRLGPSDCVLDVGCSDGYFLQRLTDRCSVARAVGVDLSEVAIRRARQLTALGTQRFEFLVASGEALPFPNDSFHKIIVNEVIEHVPDPDKTFAEIARVAKPGALIYITAPNSLEDVLPLFRSYCARVDRVEGHLRRYSREEFRRAVGRAGLEIVRYTYQSFIACFVWYNFVIYNDRLKEAAMRFITKSAPRLSDLSSERPKFNFLSTIPFAIMYLVKLLDAPFSRSRGCMGIHLLVTKAH